MRGVRVMGVFCQLQENMAMGRPRAGPQQLQQLQHWQLQSSLEAVGHQVQQQRQGQWAPLPSPPHLLAFITQFGHPSRL